MWNYINVIKMYIDKYLIEDKLYKLIDQFNERKISHRDFYFVLIENIHPFHDRNWITCKTLFVINFN